MNFSAFAKPRHLILLIVSLALFLFPLIFSTSIQAFRIAPENIATDNLRQIGDNDLWANSGLIQAISLAEDKYNARGGYKSSAFVDVVPYEAMVTVVLMGLQPFDILNHFIGDVLYHHMYYRVTVYFSILPIAVGVYCLLMGGAIASLTLVPKAITKSSLSPRA